MFSLIVYGMAVTPQSLDHYIETSYYMFLYQSGTCGSWVTGALHFWWNNMKKEIAEYVDKCLTCHKVKAKDQRLVGELRTLEIPTCK